MKGSTAETPTRVLLLGPRPIEGDVIGGTKVLFERNLQSLSRSPHFDLDVVNTSRARAGRGRLGRRCLDLVTLLRVLGALVLRARRAQVVCFNVSSQGVILSGALVWMACRLLRRPLVVRLFGGDLDVRLERAPRALRWLAERSFLRSELLVLETEGLCAAFADRSRVRRLANTRATDVRPRAATSSNEAVRFVFVSQLRAEKGLEVALSASDALPEGAQLDFYGPPVTGREPELFANHPRARWLGELEPAEVARTLVDYDGFVFPTLYPLEGMPGAVLEAQQCGLPVVASRWRAAHEMIEPERDGLLVPPGDAEALAHALRRLCEDAPLRARLAAGSLERGAAWLPEPWQDLFEHWLAALARGENELEREPRASWKEAA